MIDKLLNLFFDEIVYVPIWLHEKFHQGEDYVKDVFTINNRYDVILYSSFVNIGLNIGILRGFYVHTYGVVTNDNERLCLTLFVVFFVYLLLFFFVRYLKRRYYVEKLMDKYFTYSDGYRKWMSYVWFLKYVLLVLNPFILLIVLFA